MGWGFIWFLAVEWRCFSSQKDSGGNLDFLYGRITSSCCCGSPELAI